MSITVKEVLERGVAEIVVARDLEKKLHSKTKLRIKHGVDPTTPDLHLGYAVIYEKLRQFQELGHQIVFLIGGFTARFGDPTDKVQSRTLRQKETVEALAGNYLKQLGKILDIGKVEVRDNSEWYDKMSLEDGLRLMSKFTVSRMIERDMFQQRIKEKKEIQYHEPVYPMLQGYDSVMLRSDLTVIGQDQKFNELQARELQKEAGQTPQDLMMMPLLLGTDGQRKMSQSLGNYIGLAESPAKQYGKIMSIPDQLIDSYFTLITRLPMKEILEIRETLAQGKVNPRDLKAKLAFTIVSQYHDKRSAVGAETEFNKIFRARQLPSDLPEVKIKKAPLDLTALVFQTKLVSSKSEARRLISQSAVKIDDRLLSDPQQKITPKSGMVIKIGKRRFCKIV